MLGFRPAAAFLPPPIGILAISVLRQRFDNAQCRCGSSSSSARTGWLNSLARRVTALTNLEARKGGQRVSKGVITEPTGRAQDKYAEKGDEKTKTKA